MSLPRREEYPFLVLGLLLATLFWLELFRWRLANFWLVITVAAAVLTAFALWRRSKLLTQPSNWIETLALALGSAALLYALFFLGAQLTAVLPFQQQELAAIYGNKRGTAPGIIALVMVLVVGPGEEIFWRGYVQGTLAERLGGFWGWLLGSFFYAGVHFCSGNFMLIGAAATAGLFWGWLYWRYRNLWANIFSHVLWDVTIFLLLPIQ